MFKVRLHPLFNEEGAIGAESGVEAVPAAEEQATPQVETSEPGVNEEVAAEPERQNNFEKAFAKRLAAKEAEWEAKNAEKYKDYDALKKTADFFQQRHGFNDLMSMKEEIEMAELQQKAEANNISPEMQKRLESLEEKAAKADVLEQQQQQTAQYQEFRSSLEKFAAEKNANADELHKYMFDNQIGSMDVAYKAMRADQLEQQLATAKEDSIKEYLASKQAPKVEGSIGAAGTQSVDTSKMSWKELDKHAAARLEAAKTPQ